MNKKIYAIYGFGGYGSEVLPLMRENYNENNICFIDDSLDIAENIKVNTFTFNDFLNKYHDYEKFCSIAIANSKIRKDLYFKCINNDIKIINVSSKNSIILDNNSIGDGLILNPFTCITSNSEIGLCFQANLYSYVGHNCIIEDFVTFAPSVKCNGNVIIKEHVYVGTGSIIYPGSKTKPLIIGKNSIISAGSIVRKNIPDNSLFVKGKNIMRND